MRTMFTLDGAAGIGTGAVHREISDEQAIQQGRAQGERLMQKIFLYRNLRKIVPATSLSKPAGEDSMARRRNAAGAVLRKSSFTINE
jgi:hypothetical protein